MVPKVSSSQSKIFITFDTKSITHTYTHTHTHTHIHPHTHPHTQTDRHTLTHTQKKCRLVFIIPYCIVTYNTDKVMKWLTSG